MTLEESLKLPRLTTLKESSGLTNPTRSTLSGLNWLAVPADCVGIAYFASPSTSENGQQWSLQAVSVTDDRIQVLFSTFISAPAVNIAASSDGLLVAVCLADGSLTCFDSTSTAGLEPRWTIPNAHSHVVSDIESIVPSRSRDQAASGAGPIRSLAFSAHSLVLVDAQRGLSLYRAEQSAPTNTVAGGQKVEALCAAWCPSSSTIAIGRDGEIHMYEFDPITHTMTHSGKKLDCPIDNDDDGWKCTHLDWIDSKTLIAGYCRVDLSEDADDEDEQIESAAHLAELYVMELSSDMTVERSIGLGDVVPFFSIPKHGRHVFFTATTTKRLFFVGSNVASDVGVVVKQDGWQICEINEGDNIMTPTDESDEFSFPCGLSVLNVSTAGVPRSTLLLASTDGTLSVLSMLHEEIPDYFDLPQQATTTLPPRPVPLLQAPASSPTKEAAHEKSIESSPAGVPSIASFGSSQPAAAFSFTAAPAMGATATSVGTSVAETSAPTFGFSTAAFGSGSAAPVFGSTSMLGVPAASPSPAVGATSSLGTGSTTPAFASGSSPPLFGSGGSIPTFGSGSATLQFGFGASPSPFGAGSSSNTTGTESPFNLFGSKTAVSSSALSMAKPLFGTTTSPAPTVAAAPSPPKTPPKDPSKAEVDDIGQAKATSASAEISPELPSAAAKKASRVFDSVDKDKTGKLPTSMMEDLLDELGEGFHGEELSAQIAVIDKNETGQLERSAFIIWYENLMKGERDTCKEDESDSDDDEERLGEEENAREWFMKLAKKSGSSGSYVIQSSEFGNLLESMGTTYCEESHSKVMQKLEKDGEIRLEDFVQWYVQWVFEDDDSFSDEEVEVLDEASTTRTEVVSSGWGDTFETDETQWKCNVCMVSNKDNLVKCAACETPRPGHEESAKKDEKKDEGAAGSATGTQAFSLGFASTAPNFSTSTNEAGPGGFRFGLATASTAGPASVGSGAPAGGFKFGVTDSSQPGTGISFGVSTTAVKTKKEEAHPNEAKAIADTAAAKTASRVFDSYDKNKTGVLPTAAMEELLDELGEGFHGEELAAQVALIDKNGSGQLERSAFVVWYDNLTHGQRDKGKEDEPDTDDDEDRREEEENARESFMKLAKKSGISGSFAINSSEFGNLLESMGTTYCEESHSKVMQKLEKDGEIRVEDFVQWYVQWVFDGDDAFSDDEAEVLDDSSPVSNTKTEAVTSGWGDTFKTDETQWKCNACMVSNKDDLVKCAACETPRPGSEESSKKAENKGAAGSAIGTQEFSFGFTSSTGSSFGTSANAAGSGGGFKSGSSGGFAFGSPAHTGSLSTGSGGFKFGVADKTSSTEASSSSKIEAAKPASGSSSAGYPPLGSKAPTPFSFAPTLEEKARPASGSSSAGYPPLSSKAPTPFSSAPTPAKEEKAKSASGSSGAGYPPLESPTPAKEEKAKSASGSSGAGYPPLESKAPKPFSFSQSPTKQEKAKSASGLSSAGYPPLASKAPTPFSFSPTPAKEEKAKSASGSSSAGYPPLSSKAPTPFSFAPTPAKEVKAKSASGSSSAGYPPLASKAPTPFSFAQIPAQEAKAKSASGSSGAGYPPLESKAPKPFSFSQSPTKEEKAKSASSASEKKVEQTHSSPGPPYQSMQSSTSQPFAFGKPSPGTSVGSRDPSFRAENNTARRMDSGPPERPADSPKLSGSSRQFMSLIKSLNERSKMLKKAYNLDPRDLSDPREFSSKDVEKVVDSVRGIVVALSHADSSLSGCKDRTANVVRSKGQALRQYAQSRQLVDRIMHNGVHFEGDVIRHQPLDADSEDMRRQLASKTKLADLYATILEDRCLMFEDEEPGKAMLRRLLQTHDDVKGFHGVAEKSAEEIANLYAKLSSRSQRLLVPVSAQSSRRSAPRRPVPWRIIEDKFQTLPHRAVKSIDMSSTILDRLSAPKESGSLANRKSSLTPPLQNVRSPPLFSPPLSLSFRAGWDTPSTVDQLKAKQSSFALPRDLRETTFSEESREALASSGTTPEKVTEVTNLNRQGMPLRPKAPTANVPRDSSSTDEPSTRTARQSGSTVEPSTRTPSLPPKPASASLSGKLDHSFSSAPMPLLDSFGKTALATGVSGSVEKADSTTPGKLAFGLTSDSGKPPAVERLAFGGDTNEGSKAETPGKGLLSGMGDLGMSSISFGASASTPRTDSPNSGDQSAPAAGGDLPNYHKILTEFYQKHNPAKLGEIPKTLDRYKGREKEMFEKLAQRYHVPNPLSWSLGNPAPAAPSFGSSPSPFSLPSTSVPSAAAPSTFGSANPLSSLSPFSSSGQSSQSPFGTAPSPAAPSFGTPGIAASSPFGQSQPVTTSSPFGQPQAPPAPSPFSMNAQKSSPFGPSAAAPTGGSALFGGRSPRDILLQFYQQHNPSKMGEVDRLLAKYQGNEEQLFRNLAKRYNLDPSMFGLSATPSISSTPAPTFGMSASGFGQPSQLGGTPTFGVATSSPFGGGSSSGFGQTSSMGFGSSSSGLGTPSPAPTFGSGGGGFGSVVGTTPTTSFGSLAHSSGFGAGGFGGVATPAPAAPTPFSMSSSPFGAPRR